MDPFDDIFRGWSMPYSAPISQYYSSGPGDNGTSVKPPTHDHSDYYLPSNGPPNKLQLSHVDPVFAASTTGVSDVEAPPLNRNQDHPEGLGMTSSPSRSRHPVDGGDPFPTEGLSTYTPPSPLRPNELDSPYFPRTLFITTPELGVNTDTPGLAPFQYDHPSTSTRDISWMIRPNESGGFSASTVVHGSMRDNRTYLDTRSIYPTSFSQTPLLAQSTIHTTNRPSNHCGTIGPYPPFGHRSMPPSFRSASHRRHHTTAVPPVSSSQVSAPRRIPKKYRCEACPLGFAQRQGLQRHCKDVHGSRQLCPRCGDFEWSLGRKYTLRKHFEAMHPGVALPEILQRTVRRRSPLRTLA
jgi:hypothetical protein